MAIANALNNIFSYLGLSNAPGVGQLGEPFTIDVTTPVGLSSGVDTPIGTAVALTTGRWLHFGNLFYAVSGSTVSQYYGSVNTANNSRPSNDFLGQTLAPVGGGSLNNYGFALPGRIITVTAGSSPQNWYLMSNCVYSGGSVSVVGHAYFIRLPSLP